MTYGRERLRHPLSFLTGRAPEHVHVVVHGPMAMQLDAPVWDGDTAALRWKVAGEGLNPRIEGLLEMGHCVLRATEHTPRSGAGGDDREVPRASHSGRSPESATNQEGR